MTAGGAASSRRRTALVLGAWLAALAACIGVIVHTPLRTDLSAFLPASPDPTQRLLVEQLQSGSAARLLLVGIEGGSAAQRAEASRALAGAMRSSGLYASVQNGATDDQQALGRWLFEHRYLLSPAVAPERYTADGLRDAIADTLSLLGTPAGAAIKPLLERDPTGETVQLAQALMPARAPRLEGGVWVSRQAPRALLMAATRADGADIDGQAVAIARVHADFASLPAAAGLALRLSGPGLFAVESRARIEAEARQLAIEGSVAVGVLLLFAFGSLRALAACALPVASGVALGIAAVGLVFGQVHGLTLGFGSTLIGEAVDYAIYYLIQARGAAAGQGWRHWLARSWPTVRLGLLTSVCGFAALLFSGFPGLAQLGVYSVAGLIGAALATRWVLPLLMPDGAAGIGARRWLARGAQAGLAVLPRLRRVIVPLALAAAVLLLWQRDALWRGDLLSLSPIPPHALALDAELRADLAASDARTLVVVEAGDAEASLRAAEAAGQRLDVLVDQGVLAGYDSPARLLPSAETQLRRRASLPDAATLRARLAEATAGGPLPAARLEPFVAELARARAAPPLTRADLAASPLGALVDGLLLPRDGGGVAALLALQPLRDEPVTSAVRQALQGLPGVQVVDIKQSLDELYARYLREALLQSALGALAVVVLLAAWLRSPRRLWAVCRPLALAVLLTLGGLTVAGVELGILHLVGLLLVVAVGSNYALFFDGSTALGGGGGGAAGGGGDAADETLASVLLANLTTVVAFGLIALSDIPALSAIGRVVAPGALCALLLAAAYAPLPRPPAGPA